MVTRILSLFLLVALATGCTHTRSVNPSDYEGTEFRKMNRAASGKVARVTLTNGRAVTVLSVQVTPDSTSWLDDDSNRITGVATSEIESIRVVKAGPGAFAGLLSGIVIGGALGATRAISEGDDPNLGVSAYAMSQERKLLIFPLAYAAYASLATTPIGAIIGSRYVFRLDAND